MRSMKIDQEDLLNAACQQHSNLQFILEKAKEKDKLGFFVSNVSVDSHKSVLCGRHQKPTDTGPIFSFTSCDPCCY